jgi:hypothetical protein
MASEMLPFCRLRPALFERRREASFRFSFFCAALLADVSGLSRGVRPLAPRIFGIASSTLEQAGISLVSGVTMRFKDNESVQVLVITAVCMIGLMGFLALGVDVRSRLICQLVKFLCDDPERTQAV